MIARVVAWCARHHWLVLACALVAAVAGERARRGLSRDVVPDLSDPQIGLVVDWMGHPAPEVASSVTKVLTEALADIPRTKAVRGTSMTGMAYVDIVFESAAGLESTRQTIVDRVEQVRPKLPPNVLVQVGPAASATGWVFEYTLSDPQLVSSLLDLRRFQDDVLRPALAALPGVAEVASVGGSVRQLQIAAKPRELRARGLAFSDVLVALGAAFPTRDAVTKMSIDELAAIPVGADDRGNGDRGNGDRGDSNRDRYGKGNRGGDGTATRAAAPTRLRDVALVRFIDDMPTGLADVAGVHAVGGIVIAKRDANIATVVDAVKQTIARETRKLPRRAADPGRLDSGAAAEVHVATAYDRADLATRARHTLVRALIEEIGVVVLVILIFLLHGPSALVPLATLPIVLLLTFGGMWLLGVPATIMSLGGIGIALGMAVDADIVALEASHRQLEGAAPGASAATRRAQIVAAAQAFAPAILTSLLITALSFLPVFAFSGETGRLLRPLALTKTLVVAAAAVVTLTVAPALRDRLLRGRVIPELANPLTRVLVRVYRPFVHFALDRPALTLSTAALALLSCLPIAARLGGEFLPRIDEGDLLFMPTTLPGVSRDEAAQQLSWQDHAISKFDEVASVFGKVGRADTGTDPAPYSMVETTIRLRPRSEWPRIEHTRWYSAWAPAPLRRLLGLFWPEMVPRTTAELVQELDRAVRLPGWTNAWTAPARGRMDMMATGVRTPVGIRIVSPDPQRLDTLGTDLRRIVDGVPGTRSAVFESLGGETWLSFEPDAAAMSRLHVDPARVHAVVQLVATGGQIGEIEHEGRRIRVRVSPQVGDVEARGPADILREVTVRAMPAAAANAPVDDPTRTASTGQPVPLALLGYPTYARRPAALRTEQGTLVAYVYVDLKDSVDLQSYVARAQQEVASAIAAQDVRLEPGERIEWTGQYDLLIAGQTRLRWIVPLVLLSMFALLFLQFRSLTEALIVLASVPFALVGSLWTLYLLGYPLSAPVWVGLLSVIGLAMQTGVVMVVYIDEAFHRRMREGKIRNRDDIIAAHAEGTVRRLRPKIMTITTMAAALLPLLWANGAGAEIMKRVAAPMIGGLATSAFLTLEVLPVLYTIWRTRQLARARRTGASLATVVGAVPTWARKATTTATSATATAATATATATTASATAELG